MPTQNYEIKNLSIKDVEVNKGQIYGLPKNPRFIRDNRFNALKKSIEDAPEMLGLRELLVYPYEGKYVVIGGNMRLRACLDLGYKEVPCKILPVETPVAKLREYTIKDNESFGQNDWDILANEWDDEELQGWGMELPTDWGDMGYVTNNEEGKEEKNNSEDNNKNRERDPDSEIIVSTVSLFGTTEDLMFVQQLSTEDANKLIQSCRNNCNVIKQIIDTL